jgi:AmmeMemoRadiSam system protein A
MAATDSAGNLTKKEKEYLIKLAKRSMRHYLERHEVLKETNIPAKFKKKRATFVSVYTNNQLRGCIGSLHAANPLYEDIISNAVAAAFFDNRFPPLSDKEIEAATVEISILTEPERVDFSSPEELLGKIKPKEDGLIITKKVRRATFLPQVWEHFPSRREFLSHLCMKAGLAPDEWKKPGLEVYRYKTKVFSGV